MTDVMLDVVVRGAILLCAGGVLAFWLRRRAAAIQSVVLTMALAGSLALPLAAAWLPSVDITVPGAAHMARLAEKIDAASDVLVPADRRPAGQAPGSLERKNSVGTASLPALAVGRAASPSLADRAVTSAPVPFAWYLTLAWLAGVVVLGFRVALSHLQLARLVGRADPAVTGLWNRVLQQVQSELGLRRTVRLKLSDDLSLPIASGVLRPTVVLPRDADEWPADLTRDVLRHELAHVARWDAASQLAGRLACALYWLNPLAWMLATRAATLRERACDDAVLRAGTRASDYASRLLALVQQQPRAAAPTAALAMARPARIHERIVLVLDPALRREGLGRMARMAWAVSAATAVAALGAVHPVVLAANVAPAVANIVAPTEVVEPGAASTMQAPPSAALCPGRIKRSSTSTNNDDEDGRRWRVEITGESCDIDLRVNGRVVFNGAFTDVTTLDSGGLFRLDATTSGVRRQLDIVNRGGTLERTYQVDGRAADWDAAASTWFARFLIALDRRTAIGVDTRLPNLLGQGGVAAVLAETALMTGDHPRATYYAALLDARQLTSAERRDLIEQTARLVDSDHYASETLKKVVAQGRLEDDRERNAVVAMLGHMDSDYYRAETIEGLGSAPISANQASAILSVLERMDSDHYRLEVLTWLVSTAPADLDMALLAAVVRGTDSDHYRAESVRAIGRRTLSASQAASLLPLVADMHSGHYQRDVLGTLLRVNLSEADLVRAVDLIRGMDSDHYKAEALGDVLSHAGANDRVRTAARAVAESLSRHYREDVLRRIGG